jgi:hypothetical protein
VPPPWNAVAISPARRDALLRRMQITAAIISVTIAAVMVLRLLASVV